MPEYMSLKAVTKCTRRLPYRRISERQREVIPRTGVVRVLPMWLGTPSKHSREQPYRIRSRIPRKMLPCQPEIVSPLPYNM